MIVLVPLKELVRQISVVLINGVFGHDRIELTEKYTGT